MKTAISDLIVVVPGITGSVLERRGRVIWDKSWRTARSLLTADPAFLEALTLDGVPPAQDPDGLKATRLIDGPSMIPGLAKLGGYSRLAAFLDQTFALVSKRGQAPPNYLEFPYDWRLDNRQNATYLADFLAPRLNAWRRHSGVQEARIIIFAHSMGGLLARYYGGPGWLAGHSSARHIRDASSGCRKRASNAHVRLSWSRLCCHANAADVCVHLPVATAVRLHRVRRSVRRL